MSKKVEIKFKLGDYGNSFCITFQWGETLQESISAVFSNQSTPEMIFALFDRTKKLLQEKVKGTINA